MEVELSLTADVCRRLAWQELMEGRSPRAVRNWLRSLGYSDKPVKIGVAAAERHLANRKADTRAFS